MKNIISLLFVAFCLSRVNAHISSGSCIEAPVITDFSPAKYAGDWYEILHYPAVFEEGIKCVKAHYGILNATALSVHNDARNSKTGANTTTDGYGVVENLAKPNLISVFFPNRGNEPQPYDVWMTDYTSYSLVYACKTVIPNLLKFEVIWILGRQPTLDKGLLQKLLSFYESKGVNIRIFEESDQSGCWPTSE
jgi:lipocalin